MKDSQPFAKLKEVFCQHKANTKTPHLICTAAPKPTHHLTDISGKKTIKLFFEKILLQTEN